MCVSIHSVPSAQNQRQCVPQRHDILSATRNVLAGISERGACPDVSRQARCLKLEAWGTPHPHSVQRECVNRPHPYLGVR